MNANLTRLNHRSVVIYGCGKFGRTLKCFLNEKGLCNIVCFVQSGKVSLQNVLEKPVYNIDDYICKINNSKQSEELLYVIGADDKNAQEIEHELIGRGIYNYVRLSKEDWKYVFMTTTFKNVVPHKNIAILLYHRIIKNEYDFWKLNISPEKFETHIKYISENYNVLRMDEKWVGKVDPNKKYIVITFDDGYVDNYKNALPILEKYNVPATVFVGTALIGKSNNYWWDELEQIILLNEYVGIFTLDGEVIDICTKVDREKLCIRLRNKLKTMNYTEIVSFIDSMKKQLELRVESSSDIRCMNKNEIREMIDSGLISIGGHTRGHLSLGADKTIETIKSEVSGAKKELEDYIQKKVSVFAYPFGGEDDKSAIAEEIIRESGFYRSVCVKDGNVSAEDRYDLPRHMMFENDDIKNKLESIWGLYG